jgi:hypothetical protein
MSYLQLAKQAGARLRAEGPATKQTKETRKVADALPFLAMPLDEFQRRGALLEVRVPWLNVTLWMVPTERDVAGLVRQGIGRGRIWTAPELMDVMSITDRTPEQVKTLTHTKLVMDGEITEVTRRVEGIR